MLFFNTPTRRRSTKSVSQAGATSALESRVLLAGNVSASLSAAGTLTINGDSNNNRIDVTGVGTDIIVHEDAGGTVNGSNDIVFTAANVKNIVINGFAGNDDVQVANIDISGFLSAQLGTGIDDFQTDASHIGGNLAVFGGRGNDHIDLFTTEVDGFTYVNSGLGADQVHFFDFLGHGNVGVQSGLGNDEVEIFAGASTFDQVVSVRNSGGSDAVTIGAGTTFDGDVLVRTGGGADKVTSTGSTFNGRVNILLGGGADTLTATGNTFNQAVTLDGGAGKNDVLNNDATNIFAVTPTIKRFETINA